MKKRVRKFLISVLALILACAMGTSCLFETPGGNETNAPGASGSNGNNTVDVTDQITKLPESFSSSLFNPNYINKNFVDQYSPSKLGLATRSDGKRRIIVEFKSKSQLDVFLNDSSVNNKFASFTDYVNAREGEVYAQSLEIEQSQFIKALGETSLDYEIRHVYTSIINGVALEVNDKDLKKYAELPGVSNIIYSETYSQPTVEPTINVVDVYDTGIYDSSNVEYQGDGLLVAVLDTGFDVSHSAFQHMPSVQKVTKADVQKVFSKTEAKSYRNSGNVTAEDVYYNEKVPFAYDYANGDSDVFAISSSHGVHVAGIIAGKDDDVGPGSDKAFENGEKFVGVAPNAQLMIGKVFIDSDDGQENGGETDDILAALADCVTVGADVINMSLGMSKGFSREIDEEYTNEIYDKIYAAGINLVVAASNEGSSSTGSDYGSTGLTSNPDTATVGSPSTYTAALSVASISGQKSPYMELDDGTAVYYNESTNASGKKGEFMKELLGSKTEGTFNYVVVPGLGKSNNYTKAVKDELKKGNCIAVVSRGETSFEEKQKIAFENGAIACIIYNNVSGKISASLGTGKKIPTCTVTSAIGQRMVAQGKGTIYLNTSYKAGPFMSDFSSWGPTNDLKIKPEITAHGGEITSAVVGGYSQYSGTSMAAPNMAGAVALLRQHVAKNFGLTGSALANRVNQLLMSTATIVYDENGLPYSIRKQGAGLGDISKSIKTDAFLTVNNNAKPKLELGDDPSRKGVFVMEFNVVNHSDKTKTYGLDLIAMTESVSIDNITVEEKAYLLEKAQKTYYVDGKLSTSGKVTVEAGETAVVRVNLSLSSEEKKYLNDNFINGMYVEGYVTLADSDGENGVDLSIPYLAFYGDWTDAPIFDLSSYEVSKEYYDSSIKDEDKRHAAVYETMAVGSYVKEYDEYYMPLGAYIYNVSDDPDADSGVVSEIDKIAVGNNDYGIYDFHAMYFGTLRGVSEMRINIENAVTGQVYYNETQYNIRKAPGLVELELSPYELGLKNNEKVMMSFEADLAYSNGEIKTEKQEYWFYTDYQFPLVSNTVFRYENDGNGKRKVYLDLTVYDNHYVQSIQLFSMKSETEVDWLTTYPIPVTDGKRDSETTVTIDVTNLMGVLANTEGEFKNQLGIRLDDYALNGSAFVVPVTNPKVDKVGITYTYDNAQRETLNASLEGQTIVLGAGQELDLTSKSGKVLVNGTATDASFTIDLIGYTSYSCMHLDAHGLECGFTYNEREGYTYQKGDYYYDATTSSVKQKTEDDATATYAPNTLFTSIIAEEVVKDGKNYVQPNTKHFVCPRCGSEETFKFATKTGKFTTQLFRRNTQEPMVQDAQWVSDNIEVAKVDNGRIYGIKEGTANISVYATSEFSNEVFTFKVNVTNGSTSSYIESIAIESYYNNTDKVTRYTNGSSASVDCGAILDLYPTIYPWYLESVADLVWQSSNSDIVEIVSQSSESARVLCKKEGVASLLLTSKSHNHISRFTISVGKEYDLNSFYFYDYNGLGYSETYVENGEERKLLVIPANLGIVIMGLWNSYREGPFFEHQTLDTVIIPEGTTTIGVYTFANSSIRRLFLPSSIEQIAYSAFENSNIEEIYWYNASERSSSGIEYNPDNNTYNLDKLNRGITYTETDADGKGKKNCSDWSGFNPSYNSSPYVKRIILGNNCFKNCYNLRVFNSSRVTAAYDYAFDGCTSLTSINLSQLRYTGVGLLNNTTSLKSVTLNSNTSIAPAMFKGSGVEEITYYGSYVPAEMFSGASSLSSIRFTRNLSSIGMDAFKDCVNLETVTFDGTCGSFGDNAFSGCSSLEEFKIPEGLYAMGANVFKDCTSLTTLHLQKTTRFSSLGDGIFDGATALKNIEFEGGSGNNYTVVSDANGTDMLMDSTGKVAIITPPSFVLTTGDTYTIPSGITDISHYAYYGNASLEGKELVIPEGVKTIGVGAFKNTGITKVYIPESVTSIGACAFQGCTSLESVVFLCSISTLPEFIFEGCTALNYVQLPGDVKYIGSSAFMNSGIKTITFSDKLLEIGEAAFAYCEKLAEVNFAKNSALYFIDSYAFYECDSIEKIKMPDSVLALGHFAFANCDALEDVYVSGGITEFENMGEYVFSGDLALSKVEFGEGCICVGHFAFSTPYGQMEFYYQQNLSEIILPTTLKYIGAYAFAGNTALTYLDLSSVSEIGEGAFYYTTELKKVDITSEMYVIGAAAFMYSGIEEMDLSHVEAILNYAFLSSSIKSTSFTSNKLRNAQVIGAAAFYDCLNLTVIDLPNVYQIGDSAFFAPIFDDEGNNIEGSIEQVNLGQNLQYLGGGAFFGSKITTITLPRTLETIGMPAFAGCYQLEEIIVKEGNTKFFTEKGGLYRTLDNGTYELVAVPNAWGKDALPTDAYDEEGRLKIENIDFDTLPIFEIIDNTSSIGSWAMGYCKQIYKVEIPASVKKVGTFGFYCLGLDYINGITEDMKFDNKYLPKYIFKGLQAPLLESDYNEENQSLADMYATYTYYIGYGLAEVVIPVNAKGFESLLYLLFFSYKTYSEEIIEEGTQKLIEWLENLNVDNLTLSDEKTVTDMDMVYFMLTNGQKAFVSQANRDKLTAAVNKINELKTASDSSTEAVNYYVDGAPAKSDTARV